MAILAVDTSTPIGSVAVGAGGTVLAESRLSVRATHSESVLPEIDRLLVRCRLAPGDVERVVVGAGPGSFTGVRIAASLAKGFCFARGASLLAYSSLAAVAVGTGEPGQICALFDARRGQVYAAGYVWTDRLRELFPPEAVPLEDLLRRLQPGEWSFAGDGIGPGEALIRAAAGRVLPRDVWTPAASALLRLAAAEPERGHIEDPRSWEPRYGRLPAAQRERTA